MHTLKSLILLFLFFGSSQLFADTKVTVKFPGSACHEIFAWTYDDLISYREIEIGKGKMDEKGEFTFTFKSSEVLPIRIQVEFFRFDMYIEPNQSYTLTSDPVDFSNRDFYPVNVLGYLTPMHRISVDKGYDINAEMERVNEMYASFVDSNYVFLYQSRLPKAVIDSFYTANALLRKELHSQFAQKHLDIQLTQLQMLTRYTGKPLVIRDFFTSDKVMYKHKVYMDFFNSFWSKYLMLSMPGVRYGELDSVVNIGSYNSLLRLVERDTLLSDPQIREMVILSNILQMFSDYRFSKAALSDILSDISARGLTSENKKAAVNIRKRMMRYSDKKAPDFTLPDFKGKMHQLSDLEGKYVYISFWNEECSRCLAEMDVTKELFLDFDDIINFVSIYVGPDQQAAQEMAKARGYNWLMLDYNHDFQLLKDYKLNLFPYYILLNKKGEIEWFPAYTPSEGFSEYFLKMLNKKKNNLR